MSLNKDDVIQQIGQMIAFMQQEAVEKVEEIDTKAEQEFNIEKNSFITQGHLKINEFYDRKEKQIDLQRKIQHSNLVNAHRLAILKAKDDYVQLLKEEANKQLLILTQDRAKYIVILANLIRQGLYVLMEKSVTIRCRQDDYGLVHRLIPDVVRRYKQDLKQKDISVTVDKKNFLSNHLAGGVELYAMEGKIKVDNTIETRLAQIFDQMIPEIRQKLSPLNQNKNSMN